MHEAGLINDLIHKIEQVTQAHGAAHVLGVRVRLGALSHCSAEHFRAHFERASAGTVAQGAELTIEVSEDPDDPRAQDILLQSVDLEG